MAMEVGDVTISAAGVATGEGAAFEVYEILEPGTNFGGFTGLLLQAAKEAIAVQARAIASIIQHIKDNADVSTTVASGIAVSVTGTATAQTGGTTATGTGTGSVD